MTEQLALSPIPALRFASDAPLSAWMLQLTTAVHAKHNAQAITFLLRTWQAHGTLVAEQLPVVAAVRHDGAFHVIGGEATDAMSGDDAAQPRVNVSAAMTAAAERALKAEIDRAPDIQWKDDHNKPTQVWFIDDHAALRRLARALGNDHSTMPQPTTMRLVELTAEDGPPILGAAFLPTPVPT